MSTYDALDQLQLSCTLYMCGPEHCRQTVRRVRALEICQQWADLQGYPME